MLDRVPPHLFKYSRVDTPEKMKRIRQMLIESQVYFPSGSMFNDPFDCNIPPCFDASALTVERFWQDRIKQDFPTENRAQRKAKLRRVLRLVKSDDGQRGLADSILNLNTHGIVCLSSHANRMLMWSHYANGHTGVALRFRINRELAAKIQRVVFPLEVTYYKEFPRIDFYKATVPELIFGMFGSKAIDWAYEGEWRLIAQSYTGYLEVPAAMIDGVIFGLRISAENEQEIRALVASRRTRTELLRVRHKTRSFELEIVPA